MKNLNNESINGTINNSTIPTITENTTLGELISILGPVTKAAKTPTSRKLAEEAGHVRP